MNEDLYNKYAINKKYVLSFLETREDDPYLMIIDRKFKKKESVIRIVNGILSRKEPPPQPKTSFSECYQHLLYKLLTESTV